MKNIINTGVVASGGVKPSSNALLCEYVRKVFESIKEHVIARTNIVRTWQSIVSFFLDCFTYVRNDNKVNSQVVSSRINEVHCGILKKIKRYRNSLHSCGMTALAKTIAFTLAETLVVMGIIGVVAALTIPNLNQSTGDREKVAKLKKVYSNLEDAFGRATAVYGPVEEWFINDSEDDLVAINDRFINRMSDFLKISKSCTISDTGCITNETKSLDGENELMLDGSGFPSVLLADGTSISFQLTSKDCSDAFFSDLSSNHCGNLWVDIDGLKGANIAGKDTFVFGVTRTGIFPDGGKNTSNCKTDALLKSGCFEQGLVCTGWVIETGNMDYLKATNGKCPNGTQLSWENTSCK